MYNYLKYVKDDSDYFIKQLIAHRINLMKEWLEIMGIDFGDTNANADYFNYLVNDPVTFVEGNETTGDYSGDTTDPSFGYVPDSPVSDVGISDAMINFICRYETSKNFGYKIPTKELQGYDLGDAGGHRTFGYGLLYHPIKKKFMDTIKQSWTQEELENLFKIAVKKTGDAIDSWAKKKGISLKQNQKDAICSGCFNFGIGFLNKYVCKMIANNPNDPEIYNVWAHMSDAQGKKYPGLIKRRIAEAKFYFGRQ